MRGAVQAGAISLDLIRVSFIFFPFFILENLNFVDRLLFEVEAVLSVRVRELFTNPKAFMLTRVTNIPIQLKTKKKPYEHH